MIRLLKTIILIFAVQLSFAQEKNKAFEKANELYENGKYAEAIAAYNDVLATNPVAEVNYNLGNCYYKNGELGQAILHYERALLLKPDYEQAKENLNIANNRIVDKVDNTARKNLASFWNKVLQETGASGFGLVCLVLWLCAGFAFGLFILTRTPLLKKLGFFTGLCSAIAALVFLYLSLSAQAAVDDNRWAIITTEKADAFTEPKNGGTTAFVVHEGTKVHVDSKRGNWCEVSIQNGAVGWIKTTDCTTI